MGSQVWLFGVTWRHRSRDHSTPGNRLPMGGPWWQCVNLAQLRRYGASKIMGSRVWPFGVTWRHRSRDHSTPLWSWVPLWYLELVAQTFLTRFVHFGSLTAKCSANYEIVAQK